MSPIPDDLRQQDWQLFFFFLNLMRAAKFLLMCECTVTLSKAESNQKTTFHFFTLQLCSNRVTSLVAFHPRVLKPANTHEEETQTFIHSMMQLLKKNRDIRDFYRFLSFLWNVSMKSGGPVKTLGCHYNVNIGALAVFSFFYIFNQSSVCNESMLAQESVGQLRSEENIAEVWQKYTHRQYSMPTALFPLLQVTAGDSADSGLTELQSLALILSSYTSLHIWRKSAL